MSARVTHPSWSKVESTIVTERSSGGYSTAVKHSRKVPVRRAWDPALQRYVDIYVEIEQWSGGGAHRTHKTPRVFYNLCGADADECRSVAAALLQAADLIEESRVQHGHSEEVTS